MVQVANSYKHIQLYLILFTVMFAYNIHADSWSLYTSINYILDLEEDGNYVWAATDGGLVRWDKRDHSHRTWTVANGLSNNCVYWISKRPDNTFWCATNNNIYLFDQTNNSFSIAPENLTANSQSFVSDKKGGFLYKSKDQTTFTHYNNGNTITYSLSDFDNRSTKFCQIQCDNNGIIWAVTDSLIHINYEEDWETLDIVSQLKNKSKKIDIYFDSDNTPWVETGREIGWLENGIYNNLTESPMYSTGMIIKSANDIWLAGPINYLYRFDGSLWIKKRLDVEYGPNDSCYDIILTESGEIWAASRGGIFIFGDTVDDVKAHLYAEDGPQYNTLEDIVITENNELYCLTRAHGISYFDGECWDIQADERFQGFMGAGKLAITNDGTLWYTDHMYDTYFMRNDTWQSATVIPGWPQYTAGSSIFDCAADDDFWIACGDTLFRYDGETLHAYGGGAEYSSGFRHIVTTSHGLVWTADSYNIYLGDGFNWRVWTNPNYLGTIHGIAVDEQDNLWIKYEGNIAYFDVATESFAEIDFPDGYFSLNSGEITCDKFGRLWIGLDGGVAVYENEQWQTFGFLGKECSEISTRARKLEFAPNGDLWIGTFVGLFRYTPDYDSTEITRQSNVPETVTLYNHPNPFNPSTTIEFTLPESGFATITIYSLTGQKIREIEADFMPAGTHTLSWDGRDTSGNIVSSGIYITRLEAGKHTATGRMVLVR